MPKKTVEEVCELAGTESVDEPPEFGFVYLLGSDGAGGCRSYVGWTVDVDARLGVHNSGKGARSTKGREWRLLYAERYATRGAAQSREWHLKKDRAFRKEVLKSMG